MKILFLLALQMVSIAGAYSQAGMVTPVKPTASDTIHVAYHTLGNERALPNVEPVFARVTIRLKDGDYEKFHLALKADGGTSGGSFLLPATAASFSVDFYTLNRQDDAASQYRLIYEKSRAVPVEGAYLNAMFFGQSDSLFALETKYHPTYYLAYAHLFNAVIYTDGEEIGKAHITQWLKKLPSIPRVLKPELPGWYAALCIGNAKLGNLPEAKKSLLLLLQQFPDTQPTDFALQIFDYETYKQGNKGLDPDLFQALKTSVLKYPTSPVGAEIFNFFSEDTTMPIAYFETVYRHKVSTAHLEYSELSNLPEIYIARNVKLDSAEAMLWRGIEMFQDESVNHEFLLKNHHYQAYVPNMYFDLARIAALHGRWQEVITLSSAGNSLVAGSNLEGNLRPKLIGIRAVAYKQLGNLNQAMLDYEFLYKMGEDRYLDSMRGVFPLVDVAPQRFDQFVAILKSKGNSVDSGYADPAPGTSATDLAGNTVQLADFKGKLVVLNAWGIGCAPCVAEMPELNRLVNENKSNPGVVFLGIAGDNTESLISFLTLHPFDYRVLNNSRQLSEKLNLGSLPTHIVIGKNGQIVSRSEGARDDIKAYLQKVIDSNL